MYAQNNAVIRIGDMLPQRSDRIGISRFEASSLTASAVTLLFFVSLERISLLRQIMFGGRDICR